MGRGFDMPSIVGLKFHGYGVNIPWVGGLIYTYIFKTRTEYDII
jgi:hypothetical protein